MFIPVWAILLIVFFVFAGAGEAQDANRRKKAADLELDRIKKWIPPKQVKWREDKY